MAEERWERLTQLLENAVRSYTGRIEYGNLRMEVYRDEQVGHDDARIAMAYETPGGSTNQFGISFEHGHFQMLDQHADQVLELEQPEEVAQRVLAQVQQIPDYRRSRLHRDIDDLLDQGYTRRQVLEELNRLLRLGTEFRGGSLTVDELTDACRYLTQRLNGTEPDTTTVPAGTS